MDSVITLIRQRFEVNEIGEQIPVETENAVLTRIQSVSGEEWERAARNDLQAVYRAVMPACNYCGERIVEFAGQRYSVYRVYRPDDSDMVELYIEAKAGVV